MFKLKNMANETNRFVAALWIWAVALVYDNGVLNIIHDDVLEKHGRRWTFFRSWIWFDSNSIICANQRAIFHSDAFHILLVFVLAKTTHTVIDKENGLLLSIF